MANVDTLEIEIGVASNLIDAVLDGDNINVTSPEPVVDLFFGPTTLDVAVSDQMGLTGTVVPELFDTPTATAAEKFGPSASVFVTLEDTSGNLTSAVPSAQQFLGSVAMPSGFGTRVQYVATGHGFSSSFYGELARGRGTMADYETIDLRNLKIEQNASSQHWDDSALNINYNKNPPDSACSRQPAIVGSYATSLADFTPKAQVARVWGLHANASGHTAVPENGTWDTWKGKIRNGVPTLVVDGFQNPWDGKGAWMDAKPGDAAYLRGVWFRHYMDGPSSFGSPVDVGDCLFQYGHDDCHEQDRNFGAVTIDGCLYWNVYAHLSFAPGGTAAGPDHHNDNNYVRNTVIGFTRALANSYSNPGTYDGFAHAGLYKVNGSSSPTGTNAPKIHYDNVTVLMIGPPAEAGVRQIALPTGATANNSTFIYLRDGQPGQPMTTAQLRAVGGTRAGRLPISLEEAGFRVLVGDHITDPIVDEFWAAAGNWCDNHPQFGLTPTFTGLSAT